MLSPPNLALKPSHLKHHHHPRNTSSHQDPPILQFPPTLARLCPSMQTATDFSSERVNLQFRNIQCTSSQTFLTIQEFHRRLLENAAINWNQNSRTLYSRAKICIQPQSLKMISHAKLSGIRKNIESNLCIQKKLSSKIKNWNRFRQLFSRKLWRKWISKEMVEVC